MTEINRSKFLYFVVFCIQQIIVNGGVYVNSVIIREATAGEPSLVVHFYTIFFYHKLIISKQCLNNFKEMFENCQILVIALAAFGILLILSTLIFLLPMMILFGAKGETL